MKIDGLVLRSIRINTYMSREELAEGICAVEMLSQIEDGEALPSEQLVQLLADRLDVSVATLQVE